MLIKLIDKLPNRFKWTIHNVVAHPLSEVMYLVGLNKASDWIHDNTLPTHYKGDGRG